MAAAVGAPRGRFLVTALVGLVGLVVRLAAAAAPSRPFLPFPTCPSSDPDCCSRPYSTDRLFQLFPSDIVDSLLPHAHPLFQTPDIDLLLPPDPNDPAQMPLFDRIANSFANRIANHGRSPSRGDGAKPHPGGTINAVYYTNWAVYRGHTPAKTIRSASVTHVFYAFASVQPDGEVTLSDEWADAQMEVDGHTGAIAAVTALRAENPALKVIMSLGGGAASGNFSGVAADPNARQKLAQTSRELCQRFQLDGIDVDWEHPSDDTQGRNYVLLLAALREALPSNQGFILTSAVPAGEWALRTMHMGEAARYMDFINLMAYDYSGPWTKVADHHARLYNTPGQHECVAGASGDRGVQYLRDQGIPASKVVLGVPVYGRAFVGVSQLGCGFESCNSGTEGTYRYYELPVSSNNNCEDQNRGQETIDQGGVGAVAVRTLESGQSELITYDTPETVSIKAGYARKTGLGGLFYWSADMDDISEMNRSLVQRGFDELRRP